MSFLYKNNCLLFFHFFVHAMPIDMHTHLYLYLCSRQHIKVQIFFAHLTHISTYPLPAIMLLFNFLIYVFLKMFETQMEKK